MSTYTDQGIKCSLDVTRSALKGNSTELVFAVKDGSDSAIDASAYIVDFQLSAGYGAAPVFALTEISPKVVRASGSITITLDTDDLDTVGAGTYVSSLRISPADLSKTVMLDLGAFTIKSNPQTARAAAVAVSSVIGLPDALALAVADVVQFGTVVAPANATNKNIVWASTNVAVATVVGGLVTAIGAGTCDITATSESTPAKYDTCTVTVS